MKYQVRYFMWDYSLALRADVYLGTYIRVGEYLHYKNFHL